MVDLNEAKKQLAGRYDQFARSFAPQLADAIDAPKGKKVTCPVHDEPQKFNVHPQFAQNGKWYSYIEHNAQSGKQGIWDLLIWATGCSLRELKQAANEFLGTNGVLTQAEIQKQESNWKEKQQAEWNKNRKNLSKVFKECHDKDSSGHLIPKDISFVGRYLKKRGITKIQRPQNVFYNPTCYFRNEEHNIFGTTHAAILRVDNPQGEAVTLHRHYLNDDATKHKADKLMMPLCGDVMGSACRLFPIGEDGVLSLAEGFETACAVNELFGEACWATISASMLAGFELPKGIRVTKVKIYADKDKSEAGIEAALALKAKLEEQGVPCEIYLPSKEIPEGAKSIDWLDVLNMLIASGNH